MQTTHLGKAELFPIYTCKTHLGKKRIKSNNVSILLTSGQYTSEKVQNVVIAIPHLLPGASAVGLASTINSCLVLAQVHQSGGQTAKVGHIVVKQFSCLVHLIIIATITHLEKKNKKNVRTQKDQTSSNRNQVRGR